jgi:hypothetical protein
MRLAIAAVILSTLTIVAGGEEPKSESVYERCLNQQVRVQGLAWGRLEKGLGERVVTGDGMKFYLQSREDDDFEEWQGRLIEVTGVLRRRRMEASPPHAQGYGRAFDYFIIEQATIRTVDRVEFQVKLLGPTAVQSTTNQ